MQLTPFEALFLTHFVSDWLFQTKWETLNKSKQFLPLLVHCSIYTLFFIPAFYIYNIQLVHLLTLFVSHLILDNRQFEYWWLKTIKRTVKEDVSESLWNILVIGIDQVFHLAVIGYIVLVG